MAIQDTTNSPGTHSPASGNWPRYLNVLLAAWLFISAFAWPHTAELRQNSWIVGLMMFVAALAATAAPAFRYVNTVLAGWLFISTIAFPRISDATLWNNIIVAIAVLALSLMPSGKPTRAGGPATRTM